MRNGIIGAALMAGAAKLTAAATPTTASNSTHPCAQVSASWAEQVDATRTLPQL